MTRRNEIVSAAEKQVQQATIEGSEGHELGPFFGLPASVQEILQKHRGISQLYGGQTI